MWTSALWNPQMMMLQWGAVLGASLVAALWDMRTRRIPNVLTGTLLVSGLIVSAWMGRGSSAGILYSLLDSLCGALLLGALFMVLFIVAGGGAGDVKLMAGLGAWLGVSNGVIVLLMVTVTGAVLGILYAMAQQRLGTVMANLKTILTSLLVVLWARGRVEGPLPMPTSQGMLAVPYGLAIFVGTCLAAGGRLLWPV
jgi:prepilin peptidase CpaA